jgi:hypothetical protein
MEYLTQWEFWQEVALSVAARLSVVAAALWAVKMVTDRLVEKTVAVTPPASSPAGVAPALRGKAGATGEFHSFEPRRRGLTLKTGKTAVPSDAGLWREKMAKYLTGEPSRASKALQR